MALPTETNTPWPPASHQLYQRDAEEAAAWYSGDPDALQNFYGGGAPQPAGGNAWQRFWGRRNRDRSTTRQRMHVPIAADVAATSADLLFGDNPTITVPATGDQDRDKADAVKADARLDWLADRTGLTNTLLEAAEICAGIGGVYLRPAWDTDICDHPFLYVVHGDKAIPEFRYGQLVAVTFWRVVSTESGRVWRHLERHEKGVVLHGLYDGDKKTLGYRKQLADHEATGRINADADGGMKTPAGVDGLLVRYVPNALPNRKRRGDRPIGRSDTQGCESEMDGLDETFTSWMRDIRLGQARLVVPSEFLEHKGRGQGAAFDLDKEVFSPLDMDPQHQDKAGITKVQFEIRVEQHAGTAKALIEQIVQTAGYSLQTFGLGSAERSDMTATEVNSRERKTARTTAKKSRYFVPAVEDVLMHLLAIDREIFNSGVPVLRPKVDLADVVAEDPRRVAETLNLWGQARAASTETLVRARSPELTDDQVKAEVDRIHAESAVTVPDPFGLPDEDPASGSGGEGA